MNQHERRVKKGEGYKGRLSNEFLESSLGPETKSVNRNQTMCRIRLPNSEILKKHAATRMSMISLPSAKRSLEPDSCPSEK